MEWLKDLKKEELPENYQEMLGVLTEALCDQQQAFRAVIALAKYYNKQPFYFSGLDAVIARKKREYILKNRGRLRISELARITEQAERTIYAIFEEVQRSKQKDLFTAENPRLEHSGTGSECAEK